MPHSPYCRSHAQLMLSLTFGLSTPFDLARTCVLLTNALAADMATEANQAAVSAGSGENSVPSGTSKVSACVGTVCRAGQIPHSAQIQVAGRTWSWPLQPPQGPVAVRCTS